MKVMLFGAGGQLGQAFIHQREFSQFNAQGFSKAELDICDLQAVSELFAREMPDVVINCAGYTAVDKAEQDKQQCMKVNCDAVVHLAQQCQLCSSLLIQFSTDYVFDGKKKRAYTEQDTPAPLNHYGLSKLAAEQQITQYCEKYLILRTSWLFSEFGHNFYRTILNLAQSAQQISVIDDQFGSPTYAGDVAKAVIDIVRQYQHQHYLPYGVYHLSSGPAVSWYHFAQAIFAAKQIDVTLKPITTQQWLAAAVRPTNSALNSNKIQTALGLVVPDWHNALAKLVRGHA